MSVDYISIIFANKQRPWNSHFIIRMSMPKVVAALSQNNKLVQKPIPISLFIVSLTGISFCLIFVNKSALTYLARRVRFNVSNRESWSRTQEEKKLNNCCSLSAAILNTDNGIHLVLMDFFFFEWFPFNAEILLKAHGTHKPSLFTKSSKMQSPS